MSDFAVRAVNLTKAYTLYPRPIDRLSDLLGLSRLRRQPHPTHTAVDNLSIEIRKGEKVGFIGRNGAGKSTLLKLITGVIEPTSGHVEISGASHALLQMGAGFHQELTGRENAYAYLANLGVMGKEADRLVDEIVEFTELELYIDQPIKTYSTGMAMRLIFGASTAVAPSLFVVDEVLGVGDAYFQGKSFARIEELCARHGTTLLLVSHDIYGAARICKRMVWLDRGQIKYDGDPKSTLNFYENSIKEQEEERLRKKAMLPTSAPQRGRQDWPSCLVELRPPRGTALNAPVRIVQADLTGGEGRMEFVREGANWSPEPNGSGIAELQNVGSTFQKGVIRISAPTEALLHNAALSLRLICAEEQELQALLYPADGKPRDVGAVRLLPEVAAGWDISLDAAHAEVFRDDGSVAPRHGSGAVRYTSVDILDRDGFSTRLLKQGEPITIAFGYKLADPSVADDLELMISITKDGVLNALRAFNTNLVLPPGQHTGTIHFTCEHLPMASGTFVLSSLIAKRGYYDRNEGKPFSVNHDVYDMIARGLEFEVRPSGPAYQGTILEWQGRWSVILAISEQVQLDYSHRHRTNHEGIDSRFRADAQQL
jgi:lipopolysaccharide transport system ATP-binding protein